MSHNLALEFSGAWHIVLRTPRYDLSATHTVHTRMENNQKRTGSGSGLGCCEMRSVGEYKVL